MPVSKVIFLFLGKKITINLQKSNIHLSSTLPGDISEKKKHSETADNTAGETLGETQKADVKI